MNHLTVNDTIRIERRIYWRAGEGTDRRVDRWLGIADSSLSLAARELCCLVGADNGFRKAAAKLQKLGQIQVSPERLRTVVQAEGRQMLEARRHAVLLPDWDAGDCTVDASGKTRVLVGGGLWRTALNAVPPRLPACIAGAFDGGRLASSPLRRTTFGLPVICLLAADL